MITKPGSVCHLEELFGGVFVQLDVELFDEVDTLVKVQHAVVVPVSRLELPLQPTATRTYRG